jgi:hypothetical protein
MTKLEKMAKALDFDFLGRDLLVALFPRLMLASVIRERSERHNASGSVYARRSETCMLCIVAVR